LECESQHGKYCNIPGIDNIIPLKQRIHLPPISIILLPNTRIHTIPVENSNSAVLKRSSFWINLRDIWMIVSRNARNELVASVLHQYHWIWTVSIISNINGLLDLNTKFKEVSKWHKARKKIDMREQGFWQVAMRVNYDVLSVWALPDMDNRVISVERYETRSIKCK